MKNCYSCLYAIFDTVPYGSTSAEMLSGCKRDDDMGEEEYEKIMNDVIDCPYYAECED